MLKKTHIVVGTAAGLAAGLVTGAFAASPRPMQLLAVGICTSAMAGVLPDIDSASTEQHRDADRICDLAVAGILAAVLIFHFLSGSSLVQWLKSLHFPSGVMSALAGFAGLLAFCFLGKDTSHRSFTHSAAALAAVTACANMIGSSLTVFAAAAYASHLIIDFFNRRGEQLLYPLPGRYSLGLCRSDGAVNRALLLVGTVVSFLLFVLIVLRFR